MSKRAVSDYSITRSLFQLKLKPLENRGVANLGSNEIQEDGLTFRRNVDKMTKHLRNSRCQIVYNLL